LSSKLGPVGYPEGGSVFLGGGGGNGLSSRPFSESTQAVIDSEVSRLVREAEQTAVTLIRTHQRDLDRLAELLVEKETVDGAEVYRLLGLSVPEHQPEGQAIAPGRAAAAPGRAAAAVPSAAPSASTPSAGTHTAGPQGAGARSAGAQNAGTHSASAAPNSARPEQPPPDAAG
jgi:cell division protease FtsH